VGQGRLGGLFGSGTSTRPVVQVALGKPDADTILDIIARPDHVVLRAATLYRLLVQTDIAKHDLGVLRHCTSAGEPLNPEVIRAWRDGPAG